MAKGVVRWFSNSLGYGFISGEDGSDIFVHYSEILADGYRTLEEGQPVEFNLTETDKGPKAEQVTPMVNVEKAETETEVPSPQDSL
ncbi:MAG: cold-shock protein [Planctomycetota bacterium]